MNPRVGCVVLAAGQSHRFGTGDSKLLLPVAGKSLVQHAIDAAAQSLASSCTLVVGAHAEEILQSVDSRRCAVVDNPDWREGIASSLRAGLAQHLDDDACIFMVADQPFVNAVDLDQLIRRFMERRTSMVALRSNDVWGSPMLFPQSDFHRAAAAAWRCRSKAIRIATRSLASNLSKPPSHRPSPTSIRHKTTSDSTKT